MNSALTSKNKPRQSDQEKRIHPRVDTKSLFVSEKNGEMIFVSPAVNMSMGGIFLRGRVASRMDAPVSILKILHGENTLTVEARMIRDGRTNDVNSGQNSFGAAYEFIHCIKSKERLSALLRNLD
jgi:hypothetical protein